VAMAAWAGEKGVPPLYDPPQYPEYSWIGGF
jgi:hypothetical protein